MHDKIKKFSLAGEMNDDNIVEERERLIHFLENQMRDSGVVPELSLEPQFTLNYLPEQERYKFELSIYGVSVGKEIAWRASGVMNGKPVMKPTAQVRSKQS